MAYVYMRRNGKRNVIVATQDGERVPVVAALAGCAYPTGGDALDALNRAAAVEAESSNERCVVLSSTPVTAFVEIGEFDGREYEFEGSFRVFRGSDGQAYACLGDFDGLPKVDEASGG